MWNPANRIFLFTALLCASAVQAATGDEPAQYGEPSAVASRPPEVAGGARFGTGFETRLESHSGRAERPERIERVEQIERVQRPERIERFERGRGH